MRTWSRVKALRIGCIVHGQLVHTGSGGLFYAVTGQLARQRHMMQHWKFSPVSPWIMRHEFKPAEIHTQCCKDKNLTRAKNFHASYKKGQGNKENSRRSMSGTLCPSNKPLVCTDLETSAKKLGNLFCSMLLVIRFIYKQYVQKYKYIHVALLTNLQADCLKPNVFILRTDLCPFHDCVSCSLHATCHLF